MNRAPSYFHELIDVRRISPPLLDDMLAQACPALAHWLSGKDVDISIRDVRKVILANLEPAFSKGLVELAQARSGRFGWGSDNGHLTMAWSPYFDVLVDGIERFEVRVDGVARFKRLGAGQAPGVWLDSSVIRTLDVEWACTVELAVAEGRDGVPMPFYQQHSVLTLPTEIQAVQPVGAVRRNDRGVYGVSMAFGT